MTLQLIAPPDRPPSPKFTHSSAFIVWGFVAGNTQAWPDASFVAPHLVGANDNQKKAAAWGEFWDCWNRLSRLGLIELVGHLIHADTTEGEIIHPVAISGTGTEIEQKLGRAAVIASQALVTAGQYEWAVSQGVSMLAPVRRHIENVQMVGIARLRYRPRTNRTLAFMERERDWLGILDCLAAMAEPPLATSRGHQG